LPRPPVPKCSCPWQVEAHSKIFLDDWLICDLEYVKHCSLGFDLKILFKTLKEAQILIER